jgi:hypothetical protein
MSPSPGQSSWGRRFRLPSLLVLLALASNLNAAILRGTVVEAQTGKVLARTLVAVHPVAGSAGSTQSVRTNTYGVFLFPPMPAGAYLVSVVRKGFVPVQYGQKQWNAAGAPVILQESEETVLRIAMPRFGAITGRISDEADVGLVEHDVFAYRNVRPPVMVAKAATDDRGMFRIFGLEPGSYVVRTGAKQYDDGGGYLPTFYKETPLVDNAYAVKVVLDRDTPDVNIRPTPGRLFSIAGQVLGPGTPPQQWSVSLISDVGWQTMNTDQFGRFHFNSATPGRYDLLAESPRGAGWLQVEIDRDRTDTRLQAFPLPAVEFVFEDAAGARVDAARLQLLARRKELWGTGVTEYLQLVGSRAYLAPGRWEFTLAPNPSFYASGWTGAVINYSSPGPQVRFAVSSAPGAIHGTVTNSAGEAAPGAPVYLERAGETRNTRTDIHGAYSFAGLAPGDYLVVSTLDAHAPGTGQAVKVEEARDVAVDLRMGPG